MKSALLFAAGFGAGWLARSTFQSSKTATVQILALTLDAVGRVRRALAIEREQFEDLVAEAHDVAHRRRAARVAEAPEAPVEKAA
jgi:hypothetical protein